MTDRRASDGPRTLGDDDVRRLWESFKVGDPARCPRDDGPLALAVDASVKSYRLVCTQCGSASSWFEAAANGSGIQVKNPEDQHTGSGLDDD